MKRYAYIPVALLLFSMGTGRPTYAASTYVPVGHPAYLLVEAWVSREVLPPSPMSARPITWERLERILKQAQPQTESDHRRLVALRDEVAFRTSGRARAEVSFTGAFVEGQELSHPTVPSTSGGPTVAHLSGRRLSEHFGGYATLSLSARPLRHVALQFTPYAHLGSADGGNPGWQEGYANVDAGPFTASVGRQTVVWGPARHGGFLLSSNAAPLPALRLGLARPWQGARLGALDTSLFVARLERGRAVPKPYLTGLRIVWQPFARFTLGAGRATILGGEGQGLSFNDFLEVLTGKNRTSDDTSNSVAGVDMALTVPLGGSQGRALKLYAEYAGEDEASAWPTKPAVRGGLFLSGPGSRSVQTLRAEFAATDVFYDHQKWPAPVWYGHSTYASGYTYRGRILGDPMGPDARDARVWWTRTVDGSHLEVSMGWLATAFSDPVREERWNGTATLSLALSPMFGLDIHTALEEVRAASPDGSRWQYLGMVTFRFSPRSIPVDEKVVRSGASPTSFPD